jgi:hypothetical protein
MAKRQCQKDPAGLIGLTDRKSLLALRGVGRESQAESVRFHGRRVTKAGGKSNMRFGDGQPAVLAGFWLV